MVSDDKCGMVNQKKLHHRALIMPHLLCSGSLRGLRIETILELFQSRV